MHVLRPPAKEAGHFSTLSSCRFSAVQLFQIGHLVIRESFTVQMSTKALFPKLCRYSERANSCMTLSKGYDAICGNSIGDVRQLC